MNKYVARRLVGIMLGSCMLTLSLAGPPARAASQRGSSPANWLVWDPTTRTVTLTLIAGYNAARQGFNFNGYSTGTMVIQVPAGTHVQVLFRNQGAFPHSALITGYPNHTHSSAQGFPLAFAGASSPDPARGAAPGQTQHFAFVATRPGRYAVVCAVDHHAQHGMWDTFLVTAGGEPTLELPQ